MLSNKDLVIVDYDKRVDRLLKGQTQKSLVDFVSEWLNIPELQPQDKSTTIDDYKDPQLSKQTILERITKHDWPNGLHAIQIAQIETKAFITSKRARRWKVGRLLKDKGKLRLELEISEIEDLIYDFLSQLFSCYLYTTHNKQTDLYWMRVEIYSTHENASIETEGSGFLIFYPQTEFVLMSGKWDATVEKYINEALLHVFQADRLLTQKMKGDALEHLKHVIKKKKSQGIFAQLRNNQIDSNPLDIRQKAQPGYDERYLEKGEQEKRIKSLDSGLSEARYQSVMENFGWDHIYGTTSLNLHVALPIKDENDEDLTDVIQFTMQMKGTSIPLGIKEMIKTGQIDMPPPSWLVDIGSTGYEDLYITKEGVSNVEPEEEDEEEEEEQMDEEDDEVEEDDKKDQEEVGEQEMKDNQQAQEHEHKEEEVSKDKEEEEAEKEGDSEREEDVNMEEINGIHDSDFDE